MIDADIIRQLADPQRYPGGTGAVIQYQTHLSLVCVVGDRAYKLKKSLRLPFVDFSTLAERQRFCEEEVRLNARLCPDVYLGVVPLLSRDGTVSFCEAAGGEIVDCAVLMRRLPAENMLDVLLAQGSVTPECVARIAAAMAQFHRDAALDGDEATEAAARLRDFALANFDETASYCGAIFDPVLHQALRGRAARDFAELMPVLETRAAAGRVADGHGDLHARNICLCEPMAIYDCLEFNRALRVVDVAAENAFLIMDLRYRGHAELGAAYLDRYVAASGDEGQRDLIPMLVRYRAMVRAKVAAIGSGEPEIVAADHEGLVQSARRHLSLVAASAIEQDDRPWLICTCGLPASGKSYTFEALRTATGWPCFSSDITRKELAGIAPTLRAPSECYTPAASERTYAEILRRASTSLHRGPVLLDANFASASLRGRASATAAAAGARILFVWFRADERQTGQRMAQRARDAEQVSDADLAVYRQLETKFEPPSEVLDLMIAPTAGDLDQRVAAILQRLIG